MRRRTFLATAGTLLTAGCGAMRSGRGNSRGAHVDAAGSINESEFSFENMEGEHNFSMGDFEDRDFEFNESAFEADFGSRSGKGGEGTRTPIETNPRATKLMKQAMKGIQETYEAYVGPAGPDANLMDVTVTIKSFNAPRVRRLAQQARDKLEQATEHATEDQRKIVLALVQVTIFLEDMARVREALLNAYDKFTFAVDRLYAESTLRAKRTVITMNDYRSEAKSTFRPLRNEISRGAVSVFTPVGAAYEKKLGQVEAELDALRGFKGGIRSAANGIEKFQPGVNAFYNREYEKAATRLDSAKYQFSSADFGFENVETSSGMAEKANEVEDVVETLETVCQALASASRVKTEKKPQPRFYEARRKAERTVESNEIVSDMRTANRIIT